LGSKVAVLKCKCPKGRIHRNAHTFSTNFVKSTYNVMNLEEKRQKKLLWDRSLYRTRAGAEDLVPFQVRIKETDLMILAERELTSEARELVLTHRHRLEEYIARHPDFMTSLSPLCAPETAPSIVRLMCRSAAVARVGPMAAVAGAIAEKVGEGLRELSGEVIVENGGDLFLFGAKRRVVGIFTAESALEDRLGIRVDPGGKAVGVCTSSGTIGHSLSLGEASTATIVAPSAALADAVATAVGNLVQGKEGARKGMAFARSVAEVLGAVIVHEGRVAAWGELELVRLQG
jgi:ApbE superfamily uncharacterized protein (UPF0280 family)